MINPDALKAGPYPKNFVPPKVCRHENHPYWLFQCTTGESLHQVFLSVDT